MSNEEYLATLRGKSYDFSRGESEYRGVARHHHSRRWEANIGRMEGNKYIYLGTFGIELEATHAYDTAAIYYKDKAAVTNCELGTYINDTTPYVPAKKGSKKKATKSRLKPTRVTRTIESRGESSEPVRRTRDRGGGSYSAPAMQMPENVNRTIDGNKESAPAENPFHVGMEEIGPEDVFLVLELPDYTDFPDADTWDFQKAAEEESSAGFLGDTKQVLELVPAHEDAELEDDFLNCFGEPIQITIDSLFSSG